MMVHPEIPSFTVSSTEPFAAVCNSRVEYGSRVYKFGRIILEADEKFQVPCQAWVKRYAVIVVDDYIWDMPSHIYGERATKYFKRYKPGVRICRSESDFINTPRLRGVLGDV